RGLSLGVAVGLAQLFKYNGWIVALILAASAGLWLLVPGEPRARSGLAICGWGLAAALMAALIYWPWFEFVESHGGYRALLAHHRSYLGDFSAWPGHLAVQLAQAGALSGTAAWRALGGLAAGVGMLIATGDLGMTPRLLPRLALELLSLTALCLWLPNFAWL